MANEWPDVTDFATLTDLDVDTDAFLDVLSDPRRRFVLACLLEYETPMPLADVADELATWEHDAPITDVPPDAVTAVYASLYHVHVPKMAEAGIVAYSQERDALALDVDLDDVASRLPLPAVA